MHPATPPSFPPQVAPSLMQVRGNFHLHVCSPIYESITWLLSSTLLLPAQAAHNSCRRPYAAYGSEVKSSTGVMLMETCKMRNCWSVVGAGKTLVTDTCNQGEQMQLTAASSRRLLLLRQPPCFTATYTFT